MELEVVWLQRAEDKLTDIYLYYSLKVGRSNAQRLVIGILDSTNNLKRHPEIGPIEVSLADRKQQFRYIIYKNYKIVYWLNVAFGRLEIANVFDTRQDPSKILESR